MVGIAITKDGVEVDPLSGMDIHPAAELFPLMQGQELDDLTADIAVNGQREAIVLTPEGQLLDGRNRYRACVKAGAVPITRIETSEPWAYVISTNVHRRHLSDSQRAMIVARLAARKRGSQPEDQINPRKQDLPPTQAEAGRLLNVGQGSVTSARSVVKHGTKPLQKLVEAGSVPVYTAARVAREMDAEQQNEFARRVAAGAEPRRIAPPDLAQKRQGPSKSAPNNRSPHRHQHVGAIALIGLRDQFDGLALVLKGAPDGLDPSITSEEAARWWGDLSKAASSYRQLLNLLKERKESNPS